MLRNIKKITAAAVLAVIAVILFGTLLFGENERLYDENRETVKMPELTLSSLYDGTFCRQLEPFLADRFAFRSRWLSFKAKIISKFSENIVNGVYIDDERLLDAEMSERKVGIDSAGIINNFAKSFDGTVYLAAVPTSSGVYGDILPANLIGNPESQQISRLYGLLSPDIRKIDAYNILKMLNDNYIYFRSDTKWTSYGAYCVYRTVIQKLGFIPTPYDKYMIRHVTDNFRGNLYNRTLFENTKSDLLDIYEYHDGAKIVSCNVTQKDGTVYESDFYDMSMLESGYMYDMYLGKKEPLVEIETSLNNSKKLLVIKDSYADCFIPFLIQHYNRITVVSPEYIEGNISDYVNFKNYDQALILFGIENINNPKLFSSQN